jgi:hypothetical protein
MIMLFVAALMTPDGLIGIEAYNTDSLNICAAYSKEFADRTPGIVTAVWWGGAETKGLTTAVVGVVAYVRPDNNKIKIMQGVNPTMKECDEIGRKALTTKVVPGPMSYKCFEISPQRAAVFDPSEWKEPEKKKWWQLW